MRRTLIIALELLAGFSVKSGPARSDEPKKPQPEAALVGTWKLVSAKYGEQEFKFPEGTSMVKHITPTHFMWVTYDEEGKVARAAEGLTPSRGRNTRNARIRHGPGLRHHQGEKPRRSNARSMGTSGTMTASSAMA